MKRLKDIQAIVNGQGTDKEKLEAIQAIVQNIGKGNVHLLAQIYGVDSLGDVPLNTPMTFADVMMKYNDIRPRTKNESKDNFKTPPYQMWRDQGISFELYTDDKGAGMFKVTGYNKEKHLAFRTKNAQQKEKEKTRKNV